MKNDDVYNKKRTLSYAIGKRRLTQFEFGTKRNLDCRRKWVKIKS